MTRAQKPPIQKKPEFSIHTVSLTPDVVETLRRLSVEASDLVGWPISSSAIVRALVRQVGKRGSWATESLFVEVEKELKAGVKWGRQT